MARYIELDAVVAEIDRLGEVQPLNEFQPKEQNKIDWLAGKLFTITSLKLFLDTLEVKEVDIEKEFQRFIKEITDDNGFFNPLDIAKHFFEYGVASRDRQSDVYIDGVNGSYTTITK